MLNDNTLIPILSYKKVLNALFSTIVLLTICKVLAVLNLFTSVFTRLSPVNLIMLPLSAFTVFCAMVFAVKVVVGSPQNSSVLLLSEEPF